MVKSDLVLQSISSYTDSNLESLLQEGLNQLGGLDSIISPGSRVFLKINHLSPPSPPEAAIVTHPAITAGVIKELLDIECQVTVGDDIHGDGIEGFQRSGYKQMCEDLGVRLVNLKQTGFRKVAIKGDRLDQVYFSRTALDSDFIINLPKLKTHAFTIFTGSIKNTFGLIPSGYRHVYHKMYSQREEFSRMLVDVFSVQPPQLTIMDAVQAMEGEGPSGGRPKDVGCILISRDSVAVDVVACELIGLSPRRVDTTRLAAERGFGRGDTDSISILGSNLKENRKLDFKQSAIAVGPMERRLPQLIHGFIQDQLILTPKVITESCTACYECFKICPAKAVQKREKKAFIEKSLCIHCMCCHEVCRYHAIRLISKPGGKIYRSASQIGRRVKKLFRNN
ncbi:DUF362 domain-containing protein [Acidobacteriota bacterium]